MNDKNVSTQSPSVRCPNRVLEIEFLIWLLDGSLVIGEDGTPGRWECLSWRRGQGGFSLMVNMHIINIDDGVWHLEAICQLWGLIPQLMLKMSQ